MIWVGLTGGIASGKSTAAQMLREMGYPVVDADEIARQVVKPGEEGSQKLRDLLGSGFFNEQGELNRRKLAQHIFTRPQVRDQVEKILHPLIRQRVAQEKQSLIEQGVKIAFYDVPLLFEKNLQSEFDATLLIYTTKTLQMQRLKKRESWSEEEIRGRLAAQMPVEQKRSLADHVVDNVGSLKDLHAELAKQVKQIEKSAGVKS